MHWACTAATRLALQQRPLVLQSSSPPILQFLSSSPPIPQSSCPPVLILQSSSSYPSVLQSSSSYPSVLQSSSPPVLLSSCTRLNCSTVLLSWCPPCFIPFHHFSPLLYGFRPADRRSRATGISTWRDAEFLIIEQVRCV